MLIMIGISFLVSVRASAAAPPSCPQGWFGGTAIPQVDRESNQLIEWSPRGDANESLLVVATGRASASSGAVFAWNGERWLDLAGPLDGSAEAACVYEGDLVVVGTFRHIGGVAASGIARFDGTRWHPLSDTTSVRLLSAYSVAVFQGDLVVGGVFQLSGSITLQRVGRHRDQAWEVLLNANFSTNYPRFILTHKDALYQFSYSGFNSITHLSRWNGTQWQLVQTIDHLVWDAASVGDELAVSTERAASYPGAFTAVAAWNGSTWRSLADSATVSQGFALFVHRGQLYAHLHQNQLRTISRLDGNLWTDLQSGPTEGYLRRFSDIGSWRGKLVAVTTDADAMRVSVVENAGLTPLTFDAFPIRDVSLAAPDGDRSFVVTAKGSPAAYEAQIWDGAESTVLGSAFNANINAFWRDADTVYAGGSFSKNGNTTILGVARFDGIQWQPMSSAPLSGVFALCMFRGNLFAAGSFRINGPVPLTRIARWDGTSWNPVGSGVGPATGGARVNAMCVYEDSLVVGGIFAVASGVPALGVARWNGNEWSAMGTLSSSIDYLFVHRGALIAARKSKPTDSIVRWDGTQWIPIAPAIQSIACVTPHRDRIAFVTNTGLGFLGDPSGTDAEFYPAGLANSFSGPPQLAMSVGNRLQMLRGSDRLGGLVVPDHIEWSDLQPPVVLRDPRSSHACAGSDTTLRAGFYSTEPMSFQWEKDGVPLVDNAHYQGSSTQELRLLDARHSMSGSYRCIASGSCAEERTRPAAFSVCYADFNCDGLVESQDFELFVVAYDQMIVPLAEPRFDVNEDGLVDDLDFQLFVAAYNQCNCDSL